MGDARCAYHEAGHAVAAAVLGFPFRSSGIHIDRDGVGITLIVRPSRKCSSPFSNLQANQTRMVIVLFAGLLAQNKFRPDSSNDSAADDELKINQYLAAIYRTDTTSELIARNYLKQEAERLDRAAQSNPSRRRNNIKSGTKYLQRWILQQAANREVACRCWGRLLG
jgi:hypothetical protein